MLGRFSSALQIAVDALAPPPTLLEDFIYHWNKIQKFYVNCSNISVGIEETNIIAHLDQMIKILFDEQSSFEDDSAGPCLEYLLQNHILHLLYSLAVSDNPPGMKSAVLCFSKKLLTQLKSSIVAHVNIYQPIQKLAFLCDGTRASPTELDEIQFLCAVSAVICKQPNLMQLFNTSQHIECKKSRTSSTSSQSSGFEEILYPETPVHSGEDYIPNGVSEIDPKDNTSKKNLQPGLLKITDYKSPVRFIFLERLISFLHSADNRVMVKACEGLMLLATLPSDAFARSVVHYSNLCAELAVKLVTLYEAIPLSIDPNDLEDIQINWGLDSPQWTDDTKFAGCRQLASFLAWLDYCDQLVREAHPIIGTALAESIKSHLLDGVFGPVLINGSSDLVLVIAYITKCLKIVTAPALLNEYVCWLVGESREPELPDVQTCIIRTHLLSNCLHDCDEVSLETLRLFEVLLEKSSEQALHCLVIVYLSNRKYYDTSTAEAMIESWSDEEDERTRHRESPTLDFSAGSSPISRTLAPSNIDKIMNSFLFLLPQHLHSASDPNDDSYEQYVQDADRQYQAAVSRCIPHAWPIEATFPEPLESEETNSSDSRPEADHRAPFYEGPFLRTLFTRLVRLPYQPYEINLQLTSLISRLALLPHPCLHEYLLNPLLPTLPDTNTLFSTLELVAAELVSQVPQIPNYKQALSNTRQRLLEGDNSIQDESNSMVESVIVLEEFCKELAAISFVKYHHAS